MPSGTVHSNATGQPQSSTSSSWKWIAAYSRGACRQHISRPVHREPVIPRAGTLTSEPRSPWGPTSSIRLDPTPREKSQHALAPGTMPPPANASISRVVSGRSKTAGASSLPLKWQAGRWWFDAASSSGASAAGTAPAGSGARATCGDGVSPSRDDVAAQPMRASPAPVSTTSHTACHDRSVRGRGTTATSCIASPSPIDAHSRSRSSIARVNPHPGTTAATDDAPMDGSPVGGPSAPEAPGREAATRASAPKASGWEAPTREPSVSDAPAWPVPVRETIACRLPARRVGWTRQMIEKPPAPRQRPTSSMRAYDPRGTRCSPAAATAAGEPATGSTTTPGPAGLASAQTTRTSFASTSAPVALARWNRIVSPGRTDRRSAYPVNGSTVIGSWVPASTRAGVAAFSQNRRAWVNIPHPHPERAWPSRHRSGPAPVLGRRSGSR